MLRRAYQDAGNAQGLVVYVEGHGTGTPVGDPVSAIALSNELGRHHSRGNESRPLPCNGTPPVVAVNSFGLGGANAHTVLQPHDFPRDQRRTH
jgi:acyl transferase domain-containing protein